VALAVPAGWHVLVLDHPQLDNMVMMIAVMLWTRMLVTTGKAPRSGRYLLRRFDEARPLCSVAPHSLAGHRRNGALQRASCGAAWYVHYHVTLCR
jgi:hypothetical protein